MDIFAEVGSSLQQIGGKCPVGWIVMQGERPSTNHVAGEGGTWRLAKAAMLAASNLAYEEATRALTSGYPQMEKDTWPTQDAESAAWVANPLEAETPWINRAALVRGLDREEYLRRTLVKARQFVIMSAWLTGRRQGYEDEIKAGADPVLDYQLPPDVLLELQAIQQTVMSAPAAQLKEALA